MRAHSLTLSLLVVQCVFTDARAVSTNASLPTFSLKSVEKINDPQEATAFALIYGIALTSFANFVHPILDKVGANALDNERQLATASSAAVTRPNVDTVYSRVAIDLSHSNVEITVPEFTDGRFWIFPFSDMYGNVFASLSSINGSLPGRYLAQPVEGNKTEIGLLIPPHDSEYVGYITFPSVYGFILIRIEDFDVPGDIDKIHHYQSEISINLVDHRPALGPSLTTDLLFEDLPGSANATNSLYLTPSSTSLPKGAAQRILSLTARLNPYGQPIPADTKANITHNLAVAGLSPNGNYSTPNSVDMATAEADTIKAMLENIAEPQNRDVFGNGWSQLSPSISGLFGANFAARAFIDFNDLDQLLPYLSAYPEYSGESPTFALNITAHQSILMTFSRKPPVTAFWSVTVYNSENYLVANPLNRYSLGDRSNLTYSDGDPIYGKGSNPNRDGEFQMLFQAANVAPPKNWTSNWLPVEAGGGTFSLNFRMYGPRRSVYNGDYIYPVVTKQGALTS